MEMTDEERERDDLLELVFRILFAAIRVETEKLREIPQPEPELGLPTALEAAMAKEGVPKRYDNWVNTVAERLHVFADSVRIAERNGRPLGMRFPGERRRKGDPGRQ
jgi:hypothetical protein